MTWEVGMLYVCESLIQSYMSGCNIRFSCYLCTVFRTADWIMACVIIYAKCEYL